MAQRGQVHPVDPKARTMGSRKNTSRQRGQVHGPAVTRRTLPNPNPAPPRPRGPGAQPSPPEL
jgi:hypothetical protein